jgi:tetratricopeptide (TPR) repeat protein
MNLHGSREQLEAVLAQLRAEAPLEEDKEQKALLRHECGVLEEARGEEKAALREYLAAYNTAPEFREPLEALVRIYRAKRGDKNQGKLLEALVKTANTPAESARALWEQAHHFEDVQQDVAAARASLERAVALAPDDATCWLELGRLAAIEGDTAVRVRAVEARSRLTEHPTWQGLLLIELAEFVAASGDLDGAASLLDQVAAIPGRARFRSREVLEQFACERGDALLWAHALEGQGMLIARALDDDDAADQGGVPASRRSGAHAAEALLRAAELRRSVGEAGEATALLDAAAEHLPDHPVVARFRVAAADAAGDSAHALDIVRQGIEEQQGVVAAASWLRIAADAESRGAAEEALDAYGRAMHLDPTSRVAVNLRLDLLMQLSQAEPEGGAYTRKLSEDLEAYAERLGETAEAAQHWMILAYLWAARLGDVAQSQRALRRAGDLGFDASGVARTARSLAALVADDSWYASATEALIALTEPGDDRVSLLLELGRRGLLRGDAEAAHRAFEALPAATGDAQTTAWLASVLSAYVVDLVTETLPARRAERLTHLASVETDTALASGLRLVAAVDAARHENEEDARTLLRAEHETRAGDPVLALFLAQLERSSGNDAAAAEVLTVCADALDDAQLGAAMRIEAALDLWHGGDRKGAIEGLERVLPDAPQAARLMLGWALRAVDADDFHARRRAIELAEESSADRASGALERFGLGVAAKGGELDAWAALEQLENLNAGGDIAVATALGRVLWRGDTPDHDAIEQALKQLELLGSVGEAIAAAERYRLTRFVRRDADQTMRAVQSWVNRADSAAAKLAWLGVALSDNDLQAEAQAWRALSEEDFGGDAKVETLCAAAAVDLVAKPGTEQAFIEGHSEMARLMNFELTVPGGDPQRRAEAWRGVGDILGEEPSRDARLMAAWSDLARGANKRAKRGFKEIAEAEPNNIAAWEGLRAASTQLNDALSLGVACARLGNLCRDDVRAAAFWEQAGVVLLEQTEAHEDAEIAFTRALERDHTRDVAFDKLFRRVRARKDIKHLLQLIELRLGVIDDEEEITKMYWERARAMRQKGDQDAAIKCLEDVTMLQPDHVGALALKGEIYIARGDFERAAPLLAKLATLDEAPTKQRLVSGIAAVDLYEKRLGNRAKALEVLNNLEESGLSTTKVRERLARLAAKSGRWNEALTMLEKLMVERPDQKGRAEAARLALVICRDKLSKPKRAVPALRKLLEEIPDDPEAVRFLIEKNVSPKLRAAAVPVARRVVIEKLSENPFDVDRVRLLIDIAAAAKARDVQRIALGCLIALGANDEEHTKVAARIDTRMATAPQIVLDAATLSAIADPGDTGPLGELFARIAPAVSNALGPSLRSEGVGRRERVDAGDPLRVDVARWMGALGVTDFDLYVSGRNPLAIKGVAGDRPALIVGTRITAPLDAGMRAAVAREAFALRRGTTAAIHADDHTIASIATAVCNEVGVHTPEPPYAVYREVQRAMKKALSRKIKKSVVATCEEVVRSQQDARSWAAAARQSIDRMALVACGDAAAVIDDVIGPPGSPARAALDGQPRARHALRFALSPALVELRQKLGMGMT